MYQGWGQTSLSPKRNRIHNAPDEPIVFPPYKKTPQKNAIAMLCTQDHKGFQLPLKSKTSHMLHPAKRVTQSAQEPKVLIESASGEHRS